VKLTMKGSSFFSGIGPHSLPYPVGLYHYQDIRSPEDFAEFAKLVRPDNFKGRVFISADLDEHRQHIQSFFDLGFNEVHVHNVGRNQSAWIRAYGESVIPTLVS
jgi:coenzyme F420-dependent glucose-6-phosphate dehydrogenase